MLPLQTFGPRKTIGKKSPRQRTPKGKGERTPKGAGAAASENWHWNSVVTAIGLFALDSPPPRSSPRRALPAPKPAPKQAPEPTSRPHSKRPEWIKLWEGMVAQGAKIAKGVGDAAKGLGEAGKGPSPLPEPQQDTTTKSTAWEHAESTLDRIGALPLLSPLAPCHRPPRWPHVWDAHRLQARMGPN